MEIIPPDLQLSAMILIVGHEGGGKPTANTKTKPSQNYYNEWAALRRGMGTGYPLGTANRAWRLFF